MSLVYGVGYDSGGEHLKTVKGKRTKCYSVWKDMIRRGYSSVYKEKHPSYKEVRVVYCWHNYQIFGDWFYDNYREGYDLDKDILGDGLLYSPETCRFIPKDLNLLLTNTRSSESRNHELPLGVCRFKNKYVAYCNNGEGKTINLGYRDEMMEAFMLYKEFKEALIKQKATLYFNRGMIDKETKDKLLDLKIMPYIEESHEQRQ